MDRLLLLSVQWGRWGGRTKSEWNCAWPFKCARRAGNQRMLLRARHLQAATVTCVGLPGHDRCYLLPPTSSLEVGPASTLRLLVVPESADGAAAVSGAKRTASNPLAAGMFGDTMPPVPPAERDAFRAASSGSPATPLAAVAASIAGSHAHGGYMASTSAGLAGLFGGDVSIFGGSDLPIFGGTDSSSVPPSPASAGAASGGASAAAGGPASGSSDGTAAAPSETLPILELLRHEELMCHRRLLALCVRPHWPLNKDAKTARACHENGLLPGLQGFHQRWLLHAQLAQPV